MKTTNSRNSLHQSIEFQEEVRGLYSCSGEMVGPERPRGRVQGNQPGWIAGCGKVTRNVTSNFASTVVSDDTLCGIYSLVGDSHLELPHHPPDISRGKPE